MITSLATLVNQLIVEKLPGKSSLLWVLVVNYVLAFILDILTIALFIKKLV